MNTYELDKGEGNLVGGLVAGIYSLFGLQAPTARAPRSAASPPTAIHIANCILQASPASASPMTIEPAATTVLVLPPPPPGENAIILSRCSNARHPKNLRSRSFSRQVYMVHSSGSRTRTSPTERVSPPRSRTGSAASVRSLFRGGERSRSLCCHAGPERRVWWPGQSHSNSKSVMFRD
jgi:hypothetical protein